MQIHGVDAGGVSPGFVFAAATVVLFGWEAAVIVGEAMSAPRHEHLAEGPGSG